ncbi:hypothetical protein V8E55_011555 [Tylopilus felleus]
MARQTRSWTAATKTTLAEPTPAAMSPTNTVPAGPATAPDVSASTSRSQRQPRPRKRAASTAPINTQAKEKRTKNAVENELIDHQQPLAEVTAPVDHLVQSPSRPPSRSTSDEEESQLPDAYIMAREARRAKAAAASQRNTSKAVETVAEDSEHNNSISEDAEDAKLTPSNPTSDDEPVSVVANRVAAEAPLWTTACLHDSTMARTSEPASGCPVRTQRSQTQMCQSRQKARCLDERPVTKYTSFHSHRP